MIPKMQRINGEIDKTKGKINKLQSQLRELEKQKTELENAEIIDVVRGTDISLSDLAAMLQQTRNAGSGAAVSGQVGPKCESTTEENE